MVKNPSSGLISPLLALVMSTAVAGVGSTSVAIGQERLIDHSTKEAAVYATMIATTGSFHTTPITRADAARHDDDNSVFGLWTCRVEGPSGPAIFVIEVKGDQGHIRATVDSDLMGRNDAQEIKSIENGISLRYTGELWGYLAPVVLRLIPHANGLQVNFTIMNGQFEFSGVATRTQ